MNFLPLVIILATVATVTALALGIPSMVHNGEIAHFESEHWMAPRVFLQATVVLALVAAYFVGT